MSKDLPLAKDSDCKVQGYSVLISIAGTYHEEASMIMGHTVQTRAGTGSTVIYRIYAQQRLLSGRRSTPASGQEMW